jgi:hypothetical protein
LTDAQLDKVKINNNEIIFFIQFFV